MIKIKNIYQKLNPMGWFVISGWNADETHGGHLYNMYNIVIGSILINTPRLFGIIFGFGIGSKRADENVCGVIFIR